MIEDFILCADSSSDWAVNPVFLQPSRGEGFTGGDGEMLMVMRFAAIMLSALLVLVPCRMASGEDKALWLRSQPPLYTLTDDSRLDLFLGELHRRFPGFNAALDAVVRARVGTPYRLGCLGEEKPPDSEPIFRIDVTDCTVFVLTSSAMAHARTAREAREWMKRLNYHAAYADPVSFENRIHFTYDRLHCSPYFKDITRTLVSRNALASVELTLNLRSDGSRLLNIPFEKKVRAYYLPTSLVSRRIMAALPSPCGAAFIRKKNFSLGLVVSHEGMLLDRKDLVHASSVSGKVEVRDFMKYLKQDAANHFDGVIFFKLL
jgi:hypothetical protein